MAEAITGGQRGGIGQVFRTVTSVVVITYLVAIGLSVILLLLAAGAEQLGIFPDGGNPLADVYNMVRGLTIFILLVIPSLAVVTASWIVDVLLGDLLFPILNTIFDSISIDGINFPFEGIDFPVEFTITQAATDFIGNVTAVINNLFPVMPTAIA